uniref:Calponin-homology (CH) domain-containing protein n=1 Tax=Eptatretus burgeri TaxID=7764 RepID=A0A8C4NBI9_EPTBU
MEIRAYNELWQSDDPAERLAVRARIRELRAADETNDKVCSQQQACSWRDPRNTTISCMTKTSKTTVSPAHGDQARPALLRRDVVPSQPRSRNRDDGITLQNGSLESRIERAKQGGHGAEENLPVIQSKSEKTLLQLQQQLDVAVMFEERAAIRAQMRRLRLAAASTPLQTSPFQRSATVRERARKFSGSPTTAAPSHILPAAHSVQRSTSFASNPKQPVSVLARSRGVQPFKEKPTVGREGKGRTMFAKSSDKEANSSLVTQQKASIWTRSRRATNQRELLQDEEEEERKRQFESRDPGTHVERGVKEHSGEAVRLDGHTVSKTPTSTNNEYKQEDVIDGHLEENYSKVVVVEWIGSKPTVGGVQTEQGSQEVVGDMASKAPRKGMALAGDGPRLEMKEKKSVASTVDTKPPREPKKHSEECEKKSVSSPSGIKVKEDICAPSLMEVKRNKKPSPLEEKEEVKTKPIPTVADERKTKLTYLGKEKKEEALPKEDTKLASSMNEKIKELPKEEEKNVKIAMQEECKSELALEHITNETQLEKMLADAKEYEERKRIRAALRELRRREKDNRPDSSSGSAKRSGLVGPRDEAANSRASSVIKDRSLKNGSTTQIHNQVLVASGKKVGSIFDREDVTPKRRDVALPRTLSTPRSSGHQARQALVERLERESGGKPKGPSVVKVQRAASFGVPNASTIKQMLLDWCRAKTRGYQGVDVQNFSSSWSDGLAFCALVHNFYPDAFTYDALNAHDRRHNFDLAFSTAEERADCPQLLDVEDMVRLRDPDWKCVYTYVQEFYRALVDKGLVKIKSRA